MRDEVTLDYEALRVAISETTGVEWSGDYNDKERRSGAFEFTGDGLKVFTWGPSRGRVSFSSWPTGFELGREASRLYWPKENPKPTTEITVSANRGAGEIAKEIKRRLLPGARIVKARALDSLIERKQRQVAVEQTAQALVEALPYLKRAHRHEGDEAEETTLYLSMGEAHGSVRVTSSGVRVDCYLSAAQAVAALSAITL